jgi:hypothetical protein
MIAVAPHAASRSAWVAFLVAFVAMLDGCKSREPAPERRWSVCTCDYVTDMDQPGKIGFEVCGDPDQKKGVAQSCARGAGVGAVIECVCQAPSATPCRDRDTCRDVGVPR